MLSPRPNFGRECSCSLQRHGDGEFADNAPVARVPFSSKAQIPACVLRCDPDENFMIIRRGLEDSARCLNHREKVVKRNGTTLEMKAVVLPPIVVQAKTRRR